MGGGGFQMDPRLLDDSLPVAPLGLCLLRLMNDRRWLWLILVPRREAILDFHDLTPLDQTLLTFEIDLVSRAAKVVGTADKINIGMIGNRVPMFHAHVVARRAGDAGWPGPVWGHGTPEPYEGTAGRTLAERFAGAVLPA